MRDRGNPEDLRQIELALGRARKLPAYRAIIFVFWGLIIAKCFAFEYAVQRYEMPFNSTLQVWLFSLGLASLGTFLYAWTQRQGLVTMPLTGRFATAIWASLLVACGILAFASLGGGAFQPYLLPGLFAVLAGCAYAVHSVLDPAWDFRVAAVGWWVGAFWLLYEPGLVAIGRFSILVLLFHVAPLAFLAWRRHRASARARKTLGNANLEAGGSGI